MTQVSLLVGTTKGAFFIDSTPDRSDWTVRGPYLKRWNVADVMYDDRNNSLMYAAGSQFMTSPTIHRSSDHGETWDQVDQSPVYNSDSEYELNRIWCLQLGRESETDTVYAGVDEAGLFVSHDSGNSWTEIQGLTAHETRPHWFPGAGGLCCHSILPHPTDPDQLWVGISAVGVLHTPDAGDTWNLQNDGIDIIVQNDEYETLGSCTHSLILDPTDPDRLYQQNHRGVYRSTNGGEKWERIDEDLPSEFGFPIVLHPHDSETLFTVPHESEQYRTAIDGQPAVYRSRDGGDSWNGFSTGLQENNWLTVLRQAMASDSLDPVGLYMGTTSGDVFYSTDDGEEWQQIECTLPRINSVRTMVIE